MNALILVGGSFIATLLVVSWWDIRSYSNTSSGADILVMTFTVWTFVTLPLIGVYYLFWGPSHFF
jgi:predicted membrane protein